MKRIVSSIDPFLTFLIGAVILATLLPARGEVAEALGVATGFAIAALFFLHGARLSRQAVMAGIGHWRLHLAVLGSTFVLFPILGLLTRAGAAPFVHEYILAGFLYLCLLPSTVQASIAFTAVAGGNVPAAVCSATLSNVLGVFVTPALVSVFLHAGGQMGADSALSAMRSIALQLLAPFIVGHLCRPLLIGLIERYRPLLGIADRTSVMLVVYTAFSAAVVEGIWGRLSASDLIAVLALSAVLLAVVVAATNYGGKLLGFSREDRIALVFCGSKKSLVSGVPMAGVLFPAATVGSIILPLMLFHQMQMMLCAVMARRFAAEGKRIADALARTDRAAATEGDAP